MRESDPRVQDSLSQCRITEHLMRSLRCSESPYILYYLVFCTVHCTEQYARASRLISSQLGASDGLGWPSSLASVSHRHSTRHTPTLDFALARHSILSLRTPASWAAYFSAISAPHRYSSLNNRGDRQLPF